MKLGSKGFTLIELVMVIVILGVLAAVALPKFVDLSQKSHDETVKAMVGALEASSAANFAAKKAGSPNAVTINHTQVCMDARNILQPLIQGGIPSHYYFMSDYEVDPTVGNCSTQATISCRIASSAGGSQPYSVRITCAA